MTFLVMFRSFFQISLKITVSRRKMFEKNNPLCCDYGVTKRIMLKLRVSAQKHDAKRNTEKLTQHEVDHKIIS